MASGHQEPNVVFIGDSIIRRLQNAEIWEELFQPLHCLNFGLDGDTTQNLLRRIALNVTWDRIKPKAIVLMIGTNNIFDTVEQIAEGIEEIVRVTQQKHPFAYLIVLEMFPKGDQPNEYREKNEAANRIIRARLSGMPLVQVLNIDPGFVSKKGTINPQDMPDYLHLSNNAYRKAFSQLYDVLTKILSTVPQPEVVPV